MAREFLERRGIGIEQITDARQTKVETVAVVEMLAAAKVVHLGRGRNFRTWQPVAANHAELLAVALGRSGSLRAPTLKVGRELFIGFNEEMYRRFFG